MQQCSAGSDPWVWVVTMTPVVLGIGGYLFWSVFGESWKRYLRVRLNLVRTKGFFFKVKE